MSTPAFETIPEELRSVDNWLVHRLKRPYDPSTGWAGSPTDLEKWSTFGRAVSRFEDGGFDGVGFGLTENDLFCGIDLDHCLAPETGEMSPFAAGIVRDFDSYTEITPSGEGLRVWIRGVKASGKCKRAGSVPEDRAIEVYDRDRYFTVTGWKLPGRRSTIEYRQGELDELLNREFPQLRETIRESRPYAGPPGERLDLREFLSACGVIVLGTVSDTSAAEVYRVVCPWLHEHTGGDKSGTRCGQYPDGATFFHCEHSHCSGRGWSEFRKEVAPKSPPRGGRVYSRRRGVIRVG